jgi:transposase-like protein
MPAPISMGLRLRIVSAVEGGSSIREAARRFAVSPSAAIKLMQRVRTTGSAAPARYGGHRRPLLAPHEAVLRRLVEAQPDITLADIRRPCRTGAGPSPPACWARAAAPAPRAVVSVMLTSLHCFNKHKAVSHLTVVRRRASACMRSRRAR